MKLSLVEKCCAQFACALQLIVHRSFGLLAAHISRPLRPPMSWMFGNKQRQATPQNGKGPEFAEQALEKLQGYHQLAKVLIQQVHRCQRTEQLLPCCVLNLANVLNKSFPV